MIALTTTLSSWRLTILAPDEVEMGLAEAVRLNLAASVLNLALPSKMGDLLKAAFIRDRDGSETVVAIPLVIFEKSLDVLALLAWCCFGLVALPRDQVLSWWLVIAGLAALIIGVAVFVSRRFAATFFRLAGRVAPGARVRRLVVGLGEAWESTRSAFWADRRRLIVLAAVSLLIWLLHLVQIWLFIIALRGTVGLVQSMGLTALSIFAGLVIPAMAGIGTRDLALITFYRGLLAPETAAALGLLCTARYVVPALAGLPFIGRYVADVGRNTKTPPEDPAGSKSRSRSVSRGGASPSRRGSRSSAPSRCR
ncbi:MAG: lysylphosphatidylglycerol synthase transmembrane domain-containing protein [Thermoanaerobaculales bacterium]|jgi:uncharacterized protein (TIRG00374 family)|nr:lysylphosphatidylglycerol synthase transmembrane domain-containing protein [Thermoanaerobaculales bacterium]